MAEHLWVPAAVVPDRVERHVEQLPVGGHRGHDAQRGGVYWADTGNPSQYLQVMLDLVDGRRAVDAPPAVAADAEVTSSAVLDDVVVMAGASVAGTVRRSALLPGSTVEAGAEVVDSLVGPGAVVGAGARVVGGSVLGDGVKVAPGEVVDGRRIPEPD